MALQGYKVVYEDENQQVIPHWDEAKNTAFDNTGTNLVSQDVQSAVKELNDKIGQGGSNVSYSGNIKKLEDFVYVKNNTKISYADVFDTDLDKTFDLNKPTVGDDAKTSINYLINHITDVIYYQGDANINWNEAGKLNPANWTNIHNIPEGEQYPDISLISPYSVYSSNDWSATKPSAISGKTIYISYRVWNKEAREYGDYVAPITLTQYDNNDIYPKQSESTFDRITFIQERFTSFYADQLANADLAREFIQAAIDSIDSSDLLLFPKGRTHIIRFNVIGRAYDELDSSLEREYTNALDYGTLTNAVAFTGIRINRRVNIDMNDSIIKSIPHWLINYAMIRVTIDKWAHSTPSVINDPSGTSIKNGIFDGSWDQYFYMPNHVYEEHVSNFSSGCDVTLDRMESKNVPGDAFTIGDSHSWNAGNEIKFYHKQGGDKIVNKGYILANGNIKTTDADNTAYSDYYEISLYNAYHQNNIKLIARPLYQWEGYNSFVDNGRYWVNEYFTVAYYKKEINNSYTKLRVDTVQFGDILNIPNGATHFRFSVMRDSMYDTSTNKFEPYTGSGNNPNAYNDYGLPSMDTGVKGIKSLFLSLMIGVTQQPSNVILNNCYAHDSGRDGMTLSGITTGLIRNCEIHNSEQVDIDIESTAYFDHSIVFDGLRGKPSISSATGHSLRLVNCSLSALLATNPDIIVENSDIDAVSFKGMSYEHFKNITKPRRIIRNSVVRNTIDAAFTVFDNCVLGGDKMSDHDWNINQQGIQYNSLNKFVNTEWNANYGNYKNTFVNTTIKTNLIGPGVYKDCVIMNVKYLQTSAYNDGNNEQNHYTFDNCIIKVPHWKCATNYKNPVLSINNCDITFTTHTTGQTGLIVGLPNGGYHIGTNFYGCKLKCLTNSIIRFAPNNVTDRFEFTFVPCGNTKIENNIFIQTAESSKTDLINLILYSTTNNNLQSISIKDNIVDYYGDDNHNARFVFIQACTSNDNVPIFIENNTFKNKSGLNAAIEDVVFTINANNTSINYVSSAMLSAPLSVKVYDSKAVSGTIIQSTDNRVKYHITNLDAVAVHSVLQSIIEVSSLPASGVTGKIYYNTTTGTYHEYKNNEWFEINI